MQSLKKRVFKVNPFKDNAVIEIIDGKASWDLPTICTTAGNSSTEAKENAELIAKALTSHNELMRACESALGFLELIEDQEGMPTLILETISNELKGAIANAKN